MRKLRDKLRSKAGFSMSELMVCLLILMLSTGVGIQTIDSGIRHYQENTRNSQAITLSNTIAVAMRDQLAFASSVKSGDDPEFISTANTLENVPCKIVMVDNETDYTIDTRDWGYVALEYRVEQANGKEETFRYFPVSKTEYEKGISLLEAKVDYEYDDTANMFNVKVQIRDANDRIVQHTQEFVVSPISNTMGQKTTSS